MVLHRIVSQFALFTIVCMSLHAAESVPAPDSFDSEALPSAPARALAAEINDAFLSTLPRPRTYPGCKVAPLSEIWDNEGLAFEKNAETAPVDVEGLRPDAAQALDTFREMVTSLGGRFELKSAYRPMAYQTHLHEVWVKWVKQLRGNHSAACRALREEVGAEFARHQLLVKQQPVPASDHTLGLAFDAAIAIPRGARLNGKRITTDKLAALLGIKRPTIRRDPVHYKLVSERQVTLSYSQTPSL